MDHPGGACLSPADRSSLCSSRSSRSSRQGEREREREGEGEARLRQSRHARTPPRLRAPPGDAREAGARWPAHRADGGAAPDGEAAADAAARRGSGLGSELLAWISSAWGNTALAAGDGDSGGGGARGDGSIRDGPTSPLSSMRRRASSPKRPKSPGGACSVRWGQGELFERCSPAHGETSPAAAAAAAAADADADAAAAVPPTRISRARLDALARPPAGKARQTERLIQHRHIQRQAQNDAHRNYSAKAAAAAAAAAATPAAAAAAAAAAPSALVSATAQAAADARRMRSLTVARSASMRSASSPPERVSSIFPPPLLRGGSALAERSLSTRSLLSHPAHPRSLSTGLMGRHGGGRPSLSTGALPTAVSTSRLTLTLTLTLP